MAEQNITMTMLVRTRFLTDRSLAAAFTEWHRRWLEEPERFATESEMLSQDSDDYGTAAAKYLLYILDGLGA